MPRYTDDSREKVRDAVDFADLVGQRTELRRSGVNRMTGLCPFHDERTPSFGIDPVEKVYHCFGCGAGGDVFTFVMETESVGFSEALELLADRYHVPLERAEEDPRAAERRAHNDRLLALLERTAAYYVRLLWEAPEAAGAREYLASRGLSEPVCREFRVGYSPPAWDRVVGASQRAGYSEHELLAAGLASRRRNGPGLLDRFRGRLMFPWADSRGRVVGFGARILGDDEGPKYLNSAEGEVFHKGRQVYGTHIARAAAAKAGSVLLVEGYTDVIALHQAGLRNVVGQQGTALTDAQAAELAKLAPTVVLCLDADRAGQDATLKAAGVLRGLANPPEIRVATLPPGRDPADLAVEDPAAAAALLDQADPLARWQVELALTRGDLGTSEGRDRVLDYVAPVINRLAKGVLRDELTRLVGDRLGLSTNVLEARLTEGPRTPIRAPMPGVGATVARRAIGHTEEAERAFLAMCLALPQAGPARLAAVDTDVLFTTELGRRAAAHLREHFDAPAVGVPTEDPLSGLVAELVLRARALDQPDPADLDRNQRMLDLARLDRQIAAARAAATPVSDLAAERQAVLTELRKLTV